MTEEYPNTKRLIRETHKTNGTDDVAEAVTQRNVMIESSKLGATIFRNNTAQGWVGEVVSRTTTTITLKNPRPLHAGLYKGSADLIGWTPVLIDERHFGQTLACFTALEIKSRKGRLTKEQAVFLNQLAIHGGIARVVTQDTNIVKALQWDGSDGMGF